MGSTVDWVASTVYMYYNILLQRIYVYHIRIHAVTCSVPMDITEEI